MIAIDNDIAGDAAEAIIELLTRCKRSTKHKRDYFLQAHFQLCIDLAHRENEDREKQLLRDANRAKLENPENDFRALAMFNAERLRHGFTILTEIPASRIDYWRMRAAGLREAA